MQAGQQACLNPAIDSMTINLDCVNEMRIQNSSSVTQLIVPIISSGYFLRTSRDEAVRAVDQCGVGKVIIDKAEAALSD